MIAFKFITLKRLGRGGVNDTRCGFSKNVSSRERVKRWFFVTFNIIISHIFPENLSDFLTFPCYKEINGISI